MIWTIDGVEVSAPDDISIGELTEYVHMYREMHPKLASLSIEHAGCGELNVRWATQILPFERIRRITGYLVGTLERFNDGKRAEERDRVKHGVSDA